MMTFKQRGQKRMTINPKEENTVILLAPSVWTVHVHYCRFTNCRL